MVAFLTGQCVLHTTDQLKYGQTKLAETGHYLSSLHRLRFTCFINTSDVQSGIKLNRNHKKYIYIHVCGYCDEYGVRDVIMATGLSQRGKLRLRSRLMMKPVQTRCGLQWKENTKCSGVQLRQFLYSMQH